MRKSALLLASICAFAAATPAQARNGAWYVGGDFGAMIVEDIDFGFEAAAPPNTFGQLSIDHDYGFDGALFVGYDLGAFRLEAEMSYKRASVDEFAVDGANYPASGGSIAPGAYEFSGGSSSALSFMIDGMLDFGDDDGLSGFVGGGVGVARVDYSNLRAFANTEDILDDSDSRFAWQVIAGLRHAVSDNVDVTLRYRFFNVDGLSVENWGNLPVDSGTFRSHSLLGGITFNFGAPPPPR